MTRGEKQNNPGNIRKSDAHWQGESESNNDAAFEKFDTPEDGIRALAKVLLAYQRKHGLRTVRSIVNRWAPPNENDTGAYVDSVAGRVGVLPDAEVNLESAVLLCDLVKAIIKHENGRILYTDEQIEDGVDRAFS